MSERRIGYTITPGNETSQCSRAIVLLVSLSGNCVVSRAPEICLPPIRSTRYHLQGWPRQSLVPRGLIETFTSSKGTQTNQQFIFGDNTFSIPGSIDPHPPSSVVSKDKSLPNDISLICPNIDGSHLPHYTPNDSTLRLLPKYQNKNQNSKKHKQYFSTYQNENFPIQITENLFMSSEVEEKLWKDIAKIRPSRKRKYQYSDLNFEILQQFIQTKTKYSLKKYLNQEFYDPLGLHNLTFNPLDSKNKQAIIPTVQDKKWRNKLLKGEVHDETAALLGGVAGHAGLFSNANDLVILGQLLLNKGVYGGKRYLEEETVELFTKRQYGHRGLGFDVKTSKGAPGCYTGASKGTFGHSGFTGTCIWIDPIENMVYVFLSNRVHPNPKNKKLIQLKTRERIHRLAYKALKKPKAKRRYRKPKQREHLYANKKRKKESKFYDQQTELMRETVD